MTVYVGNPEWPYGRMMMCHMLPESLEQLDELHEMAAAIGVPRKWFQSEAKTPHYDICKSKRKLAVELGAVEADRRKEAELSRKLRAQIAAEEAERGH